MKKVLRTLLFVSLISSCVLTSCQKATFLRASMKYITAKRGGESFKIQLVSDADNFKLEQAPEWAEAKIEGETLFVDVPANSAQAERKDSIVVSCGGRRLTLPLTQSFKATYLKFDDGSSYTSVTFTKEGGTKNINLKTDATQLRITDMEGVTTSYKEGQLTISTQANTGGQKTGTITLKADELTASIDVTIQNAICSRCGGRGKITCPRCGGEGMYQGSRYWGCEDCGGSNPITEEGWLGGIPGSGRITCPQCHGTGH